MSRLNQSRNNNITMYHRNPVAPMRGAGFLSNVSKLYSGEWMTKLKNMLPNADDTGRPGFVGENHAILQLPNGLYGQSNYMGPNTQIVARLKRGDPPRTLTDKVAQSHDISYN